MRAIRSDMMTQKEMEMFRLLEEVSTKLGKKIMERVTLKKNGGGK
jgi:hypothetical protein